MTCLVFEIYNKDTADSSVHFSLNSQFTQNQMCAYCVPFASDVPPLQTVCVCFVGDGVLFTLESNRRSPCARAMPFCAADSCGSRRRVSPSLPPRAPVGGGGRVSTSVIESSCSGRVCVCVYVGKGGSFKRGCIANYTAVQGKLRAKRLEVTHAHTALSWSVCRSSSHQTALNERLVSVFA